MGGDIVKRSVEMIMTKGAEFRIIAYAMKEFGKTITGNRRVTHWIDHDKYAWFLKTYAKERTGWKDTFSSDEKTLDEERMIKGEPHEEKKTRIDFNNPDVEIAVFAKEMKGASYIFKGVFHKTDGFHNADKRHFELLCDTLDTTSWQVQLWDGLYATDRKRIFVGAITTTPAPTITDVAITETAVSTTKTAQDLLLVNFGNVVSAVSYRGAVFRENSGVVEDGWMSVHEQECGIRTDRQERTMAAVAVPKHIPRTARAGGKTGVACG
jgi:hypothetical protein